MASKVGAPGGQFGAQPDLSPRSIRTRVTRSLQRLGCDTLDILYLHAEDPLTPTEAVVDTLAVLVKEGLVRYAAVSNFGAETLRLMHNEASVKDLKLAPFAAQPHWSLLHRQCESELLPMCDSLEVSVIPYWGLEKGFLAGKYRNPDFIPVTPRQIRHRPFEHLDEPGIRILNALDSVAEELDAPVSGVALFWLLHHTQVPSVVASASTVRQLQELSVLDSLSLSAEQFDLLTVASSRDETV